MVCCDFNEKENIKMHTVQLYYNEYHGKNAVYVTNNLQQ